MAIYFWNCQGRLGNQIFQYAAIQANTAKNDIVLCFKNEIFSLILTDERYCPINIPGRFGNYIRRCLIRIFDFLVKIKIISELHPVEYLVQEKYYCESKEIERSIGLIDGVCQIKGFFQYQDSIKIQLNHMLLEKSRKKLNSISSANCIVAVHIRSTDYKEWVVYGKKDVTLGRAWYERAMHHLKLLRPEAEFILFSDEKHNADNLKSAFPVNFYDGDSALDDFAAISLCDHVICSPSTFSYWAAMANFHKEKIVIGPKYWAGFKSQTWFPQTIENNLIHYIEVGCDD
jgi:hypothetical protein